MRPQRADVPATYEARLSALRRELSSWRNLILASNRGPTQFQVSHSGEITTTRGSGGGLVTALSGLGQNIPLAWVACAMSAGEREALKQWGTRFMSPIPGHEIQLRFLTPSRAIYHRYYNVISNPLLWLLQHYMWDASHNPVINATIYDAWSNGYRPMNQAFAEAIADEAQSSSAPSVVMLQDYHLYLVANFLRERLPQLLLLHFVHIPWPAPRYWLLLPAGMRREICEGLLANDIVGLQTTVDVRNFLLTCEVFLDGSEVDYVTSTVYWRGRRTAVRHYPISIDTYELARISASLPVEEHRRRLRPLCGEWTIVRVDRMEPSKNITRGFRAYEALLLRYPHLQGRVTFLTFLVPSRTNLQYYRSYSQEVRAQIQAINQRFGTQKWTPIRLFYEDNYAQAIAALSLYDVLLVNPVVDGMNLVAKEGPTVNTRDGVLVLSEGAGACAQLGEYALVISPADIEGTCNALYTAITMAPNERHRRAEALRQSIAEQDITLWLWWQFQDLKERAPS